MRQLANIMLDTGRMESTSVLAPSHSGGSSSCQGCIPERGDSHQACCEEDEKEKGVIYYILYKIVQVNKFLLLHYTSPHFTTLHTLNSSLFTLKLFNLIVSLL
jgi:hypothetical protein